MCDLRTRLAAGYARIQFDRIACYNIVSLYKAVAICIDQNVKMPGEGERSNTIHYEQVGHLGSLECNTTAFEVSKSHHNYKTKS